MRAYLSWHQEAALIALTLFFAILFYLPIFTTSLLFDDLPRLWRASAAANLPALTSLAILGPAT